MKRVNLKLLNSVAYEYFDHIPELYKARILDFTPNSLHILKDIDKDKITIQAFFFKRQLVRQLLEASYRPVLLGTNIRFLTDTFSNGIDPMSILSASNAVWATVRGAASGASTSNVWVDTAACGQHADFDGANYRICRAWFHFNTASIPNDATISSAFIRLVGTSTAFANANTTTADIVASTVVSDTALADADFDLRGTTVWGEIALASWNQAGNNDLTFNATGLSNISLTGYSKFAMTNSRDTDNSAPTGLNRVSFDDDPANQIFSVTYTVPSTGGVPTRGLMGIGQ